MDGAGQGTMQSTWGCSGQHVQGVRRCCHLGHRYSIVPGGPEIGGDRMRLPDQPIDPGKGGIAGPSLEGGMEPQARRVEDSRSPQVDRAP